MELVMVAVVSNVIKRRVMRGELQRKLRRRWSIGLRRIGQIQTMKELDKQVMTFKTKLWRLQVMFGIGWRWAAKGWQ